MRMKAPDPIKCQACGTLCYPKHSNRNYIPECTRWFCGYCRTEVKIPPDKNETKR